MVSSSSRSPGHGCPGVEVLPAQGLVQADAGGSRCDVLRVIFRLAVVVAVAGMPEIGVELEPVRSFGVLRHRRCGYGRQTCHQHQEAR